MCLKASFKELLKAVHMGGASLIQSCSVVICLSWSRDVNYIFAHTVAPLMFKPHFG